MRDSFLLIGNTSLRSRVKSNDIRPFIQSKSKQNLRRCTARGAEYTVAQSARAQKCAKHTFYLTSFAPCRDIVTSASEHPFLSTTDFKSSNSGFTFSMPYPVLLLMRISP